MPLSSLFSTSRFPVHPEVLGAVIAAAQGARGRHLDDAHLLAALMRLDSVSHALQAAGVDLPRARTGLATVIDALPRRSWFSVSFALNQPLARAAALAEAAGLAELGAPFVFATLAAECKGEGVRAALAAAGFSLLAYRRFVAHGAAVDPVPPVEGPAQVTFHDDPFTPMELVVDILREIFERDAATAEALMRRVHREGRASLATMDAGEARSKVTRARARAEAGTWPLRVTVSPVT